jgi:hypothetical protein
MRYPVAAPRLQPRLAIIARTQPRTHHMSNISGMAGFSHRSGLRSGLVQWAARHLPAGWKLLRQSATLDEVVLATLGLVQVRRTRAGIIARTAVKGERGAALRTALGRLADYTSGDNHEALPVPAAKPVVQRPDAPGRWLVQISLPSEYTQFSAPAPRNHKVRILAQPTETFATMRLSGRPNRPGFAKGEAAILAAIVGSGWVAAGTSVSACTHRLVCCRGQAGLRLPFRSPPRDPTMLDIAWLGPVAIVAMPLGYALGSRSPRWMLGFAAGCTMASAVGLRKVPGRSAWPR